VRRLRPYLRYLKAVRWRFIGGLIFGILSSAASGFGLPFVTNTLVPMVTGEDAPEGLALLGALGLVPAVFLLRSSGAFLNAYLMAYCGMHVLFHLRLLVFEKLQQLPLAFFNRNTIGDLMTRATGDTGQLQSAIIRVVNELVKQPATLVSAGVYLVYLSIDQREVGMLLVALATVPLCVIPVRFVGKNILKRARQTQREAGQMNRVLNENLASVREIRAYNLAGREHRRFAETCRAFFAKSLKVVKYDKALTPMIEVVSALTIVLALYVAIAREIPPGAIASILVALYMCYEPIKKLGMVANILRKAEASLDRVEAVLRAEDSVPEPTSPAPFPRPAGRVAFEHVSFDYGGAPVLRDISVTLDAGETVALVGPSGAGKSTFADLIPRFHDPVEGVVRVDGIDARTVSKEALRGAVALVSQEPVLFDDTVANNIRIGAPAASDDAVRRAARMANAEAFIERLESGYATRVGERGSRLSGGQRQRVAIARAFLKDAPINILDEPTSALDAESEHQIQAAMRNLAEGRTVLVIAHRFSTIQHADRILLFDEGRIVAQGPHDRLYAENPLYRSLYDRQTRESGEPGA